MLLKLTDPKTFTKYMSRQKNALRNRNQYGDVIQSSTLLKNFLNKMYNLFDDVFTYDYNIKYCNSFSNFYLPNCLCI